MKPDPVIDEIHEIRHRISESVNHDPEALVKYYMQLQENDHDRLIEAVESDKQVTT